MISTQKRVSVTSTNWGVEFFKCIQEMGFKEYIKTSIENKLLIPSDIEVCYLAIIEKLGDAENYEMCAKLRDDYKSFRNEIGDDIWKLWLKK